MNRPIEPILYIPDSVKQDVLEYRSQVAAYLRGELTPAVFRAYRVPMGVYEQRTEGRYMVRVRIGAGMVLPRQLERIAELSKAHGNGVAHVTTRQDIQIHEVALEDTPDVLEGLLAEGLSSRGGGGNTVRNISACPRAGVCPNEEFDVAPYAIAAAEYFLQHKSSFGLPRKFKAAFSGCSSDCALASVADVGLFAALRDGQKGFSVFAGGGLGPNARAAMRLEEFIPAADFLEAIEAVRRLFDQRGDRANKHRARLRYVLKDLGEAQFKTLYEVEKAAVRAEGLPGKLPDVDTIEARLDGTRVTKAGASSATLPTSQLEPAPNRDVGNVALRQESSVILPEKNAGTFTVRLKLPLGDIPADDLVKVAQIAERFGQGPVRTTQLQDLLITGIPGRSLSDALAALGQLSGNLLDTRLPKIVACAGASTCKLGLCLSRSLARAITELFQQRGISVDEASPEIRISGCPNSCGGHPIARIGLEGGARRLNGKLAPHYTVFAGACLSGQGARLAEKLGTIPAKRVPEMLAQAFEDRATDPATLREYVRLFEPVPAEVPDDYYRDFGSSELFSLAGRGSGECAACVLDDGTARKPSRVQEPRTGQEDELPEGNHERGA